MASMTMKYLNQFPLLRDADTTLGAGLTHAQRVSPTARWGACLRPHAGACVSDRTLGACL